MAEYTFREIECPVCDKRFVVQLKGTKYKLSTYDEPWYLCKCPGCGEELLLNETDKGKVIWKDEIKQEDIKIHTLVIR